MPCLHPVLVYDKKTKLTITTRCCKCVECKKFYAREWSLRCVLEASSHPDNSCYFTTFTYEDECLTYNEFFVNGVYESVKIPTLVKKDYQDFLKRLRKRGAKFRYFLAGEYGSQFERPHFHILFFGLAPEYVSLMKLCWNKGFIDVQPFSSNSAYYTAGYVQKKLYGSDKSDESVLRLPAFSQSSINPPLGWSAFKKMYDNGKIKSNNGYLCINYNDFSYPLPRIFSKKLGLQHTVDFIHAMQHSKLLELNQKLISRGLTYEDFLEIRKNLNYTNDRKELL